MPDSDYFVDIHVRKGLSGRPEAMIMGPDSMSLDKLASVIQKEVTRNTDLRTKLGLKGCESCANSGFDLCLLSKYDFVTRVDFRKL